MFHRKGTQDGKDVACFTGRVRKMEKMLHVNRKSTQDGKDVACFTGRVRRMGKMLHVNRKSTQDGKDVATQTSAYFHSLLNAYTLH
ncbi:hypothetical protein AB2568_025570 [Bacillus mycoides]|uniref:hypothetical protein n=1 Tax=Bacillus mycoides TaxID=1405 RepID=UPI00346413D9